MGKPLRRPSRCRLWRSASPQVAGSRTRISSPTSRSTIASHSRAFSRRETDIAKPRVYCVTTHDDAPPAFQLPAALLSLGYTLRPETEDDTPFLFRVYASTREQELAQAVGWSAEQKLAFLTQQFQAQRQHYR